MILESINLDLRERLKDREFRREWFRAELEAAVPESFRELRELRGLTQGQLAGSIGTKQSAISRFENSTNAVWEFDFLLRMSEALDARLCITVEPAERVIAEYDDPQLHADRPSAINVGSPFGQRDEISALNGANRSYGHGIGIGGGKQGNFAGEDAGQSGSALLAASYRRDCVPV